MTVRTIPPGFVTLLELLELEQPRVVTAAQVGHLAEQAAVRLPTEVVIRRLRERGWLLDLATKGVWEFAPASRAGAFNSGDPFIELRATLARDPSAPLAAAAESAAYLLGFSTRRPEPEVIGVAEGGRPPKALRALRIVRWTPSADLVLRGGLPVWAPSTLVAFMGARPGGYQDWRNVGDWLAQAVGQADVFELVGELDGRPRSAWARTAYLLDVGGLADGGRAPHLGSASGNRSLLPGRSRARRPVRGPVRRDRYHRFPGEGESITEGYLVRHYQGKHGGRGPALIDIAQDHLLHLLDREGLFDLEVSLKGGTAIRKFLAGNAGRFSTDLDFAGLTDTSADLLLGVVDGATVGQFTFGTESIDGTRRVRLLMNSPLGDTEVPARLDLGRRPLWLPPRPMPVIPLPIHERYEFALPEVPAAAVEEMIADKLARFRRDSLARDLYDLAWFAARPFDESLVRRLLVLKVWVDVVEEGLGERPFDPEDVLRERHQDEFQREAIGYLTTPVDVPGRIRSSSHAFRLRARP